MASVDEVVREPQSSTLRVRGGGLVLSRSASVAIYLLTAAIGVMAFAAPFVDAAQPGEAALTTSPVWLTLLTGLCLAALIVEMQGRAMSAKTVALLGVLVAINSALRFAETALPGPAGFSPIFAPVILSGFVFGARFGFLMGAFTLLASALITAGAGPWLPYQMLATGWIGMSAGLLGRWAGPQRTDVRRRRLWLGILIGFGFGWGFLYGAIINLWFWPLAVGPAEQHWQPGIGVGAALERYAVYYAATSAWWDFFRAAGNALLIALVGLPTLRALERFRLRMSQPSFVGAGAKRAPARPPAFLGQETAWSQTEGEPETARAAVSDTRRATAERGLHPLTWLTWLGAALVAVMSTRNPLYLIEVLLIAGIVSAWANAGERSREVWKPTPRFALLVILAGALINALSSHFGATVLSSLPEGLPLIGGPVTLEAVVYGALAGLTLVVLLVLFAVFNQSLPIHQLVRLTPRALRGAGVTLSIALTYVPATRRSLSQIREAQAVRGHQLRTWRDWLPLWMPLLVSGLERAFQLAEAMVARGFGAASDRPASTWLRAGLIGGLSVLAAGEVLSAFLPSARALSNPLLIAGMLSLAIVIWLGGRDTPYTPYRSHPWRMGDALVVAGAVLSFAAIVWPGLGASCGEILGCRATVAFTPYPALTLPAFDPLVGLALLGLLLPAWVTTRF